VNVLTARSTPSRAARFRCANFARLVGDVKRAQRMERGGTVEHL